MNRIIPIIAVIAGILTFILGVCFSAMYIFEGIIKTRGDADQSLVFWYLPLLFMGLGGISSGALLSFWGRKKLRTRKEQL